MENDYNIEKLLVELKQFKDEKQRLIDTCFKVIEDYHYKINCYIDSMETKENYVKDQILSMIEVDKMKDTKTQKNYSLPSGKLVIPKESYSLKMKEDLNFEEIPDRFIKTEKKVKWNDYKKLLRVVDGEVVNIQTGEIINNVEAVKKSGGTLEIKLNKEDI